MSSIITNELRILNGDVLQRHINSQPTYVFIGRETPWPDEEVPNSQFDTTEERLELYKELQAVKRIPAGSVASVVPRIDWQANTVYDYFDHRINMVDGRKPNNSRYQFYVLTDEFNVYKCLGNNGGSPSLVKPTSQQVTAFETTDGYIWKFMYSLLSTDVFNYLTTDWMPIYYQEINNGSAQWLVQQTAVDGAIHNIIVDNPGAGYIAADPPDVVIEGDGTGAEAIVEIHPVSGAITKVTVTEEGQGYTYANVSLINPGTGVGAVLTSILSPVKGHGHDARVELGGVSKLIKITTSGTEGDVFPETSFRQAGLIYRPMSTELGSKLTLESTNGFEEGETVTGGTSNATGTIRLIENNGHVLWIEETTGLFLQSEQINGDSASSVATEVVNNSNIPLVSLVANKDDIVEHSGQVLYNSNRLYIERSEGQTEEIRFIIIF